ncbi:MAG TPA: TRAP transporter large permease subunit [Xanthobacteraceae bacterium]|nr:TRAP transporter large permease subunit [Xanthobacteraceae bacterium]
MEIVQTGETAPASSIAAAAARLEGWLGRAVEVPAALLTAIEVVILFAGVVSRYVFRNPFVWSDELASILFLWLAMLGAVVAFRRSEHMRMSTLVARAAPAWRAFFEAFAVALALAFLVLILHPTLEYALDEAAVVTPALEIPSIWRAAALPVGCALMLLFAMLRLARSGGFTQIALALIVIAAIGLALFLLNPLFTAMGNYKLIVFFILLVAAGVLAGAPIAFVFAMATFAFLAITTRSPLTVVVSRIDEGMSHIILLSVPLFVFLGLLIEATGMARAMVDFLASLLGHVRGGLSYVLLGAMYLVSGISGSKAADMAAVAPVLFPEMKQRGAKAGDLVALLSSSGAMSETIPPSLVLITIGSVTGVSIAALFNGGLLPALVLALALCVIVWWRYRDDDLTGVQRASWGETGRAFLVALPGLALPFLIRAAVVEGVATATEVSTIGIAYTIVVCLVLTRRFPLARLMPMLIDTASLCGAILLIIGAATAMAWALTQSGFSHDLAAAMQGLPGGRFSFMIVSIVAFVILGSVLEGIPAIVLFGPLLFPIARQVGIHEVHYAMVVILAMGIGLFAPPFGVGYYAACAIGRVNPDEGIRPIWPYLLALLVGLLVVAAVPWFSTGFL